MIIVDYSGIALASIIINKTFDEKIATATIACHEARILGDLKMYKDLKNPLIIPFSNLTSKTFLENVSCI